MKRARIAALSVVLLCASRTQVRSAAGDLLWEKRGEADLHGHANSVAVADGVVVAAGMSATSTSNFSERWLIRAHDALTGETLWEDYRDVGGWDRSQSVVIDGGVAFASGWYQTGSRGFDFVVRAYDLHTGTLRWERRIDRQGTDIAEALAAAGGRLYAVGSLLGSSGTTDFTVLRLDEATGRTRWENVKDSGFVGTDRANGVVADADAVFASGFYNTASGSGVLVRAYDAGNGTILWEDVVPYGDQLPGRTLALDSGMLFSVGTLFDPASNRYDAVLRTYDSQSGALLWSDRHDRGGNDAGIAVAAGGGRVFLAGEDGCDASFVQCHSLVRTYDEVSGALLWEDRFQIVPGGDAIGRDLVLRGDELYVAGYAMDATGFYRLVLRAYDAAGGSLLWSDVGGPSFVSAVCSDGERVYVAGDLGKVYEYATRAYDLGP